MPAKINKIGINGGNRNLTCLLIFALISNPLVHFFEHVIGIGNTFWFSYVIWGGLFVGSFVLKKEPSNIGFLLLLLLIFNSFLPILFGDYFDSASEIHMTLFVWLAYYFVMALRYQPMSLNNIIRIYRVVAFIGFVSCLYAMIVQNSNFISLLKGDDTQYNAWFYTSFFRHRNIFGEYCYLSSIASLFLYFYEKKKIYILFIVINALQIYLIESRAALLSIVLLVLIPFYLNSNHKKYFIVWAAIFFIIVYFAIGGQEGFLEKFSHESHEAGEEMDSGAVRVLMWKSCMDFLDNNLGWICGMGTGSVGKYLTPIFGVGSSHCAYFDALFDGGIIYLIIISVPLLYSYQSVKKYKDTVYKNVHLASIITYVCYNFMEAGMAPFASGFFSVTATLMLITIPFNYRGDTLVCKK